MVTINGRETVLELPMTVSDYLAQNQYQIHRIAIELNGEILPKYQYSDTMLRDGDSMEIVSFVGGG